MDSEEFLSQQFIDEHPSDAAKVLERLPVKETARFLLSLPPDLAAKVTILMSPLLAAECLDSIDSKKAALILINFPIELVSVLLRRMQESKRSAILQMLPKNISGSLSIVLRYPENTAGMLMDPQAFTLFDDYTVKDALKHIRKYPKHVFYHIPVINREHEFLGLINIRELMLLKPETVITSEIHTGVGKLLPNADREAILSHTDWRMYPELPVVDEKGIFLGMISYQLVRRLENEIHENQRTSEPLFDVGKALGELYWIGLSALFKGASSMVGPDEKSKKPQKGD